MIYDMYTNMLRVFLGSKITTDGDCSHEIKRRLLLGKKVMTNLDSIFKSSHLFPQTSLIEGLDQGQRAAVAWPRSVLIAW